MRNYLGATNLLYSDRVYFSKEFCGELVENTIRASYYTVYYLKEYAETMVKLMNCAGKTTESLEFEIDF